MSLPFVPILPFVSGPSVDADAAAWAAAVVAAGGTYSAATLTAVSKFCASAKANGYWTNLNRVNLMCGDQLAACLVPLKAGGGNAGDANHGFASGDYTEATGLQGNSVKYLSTGLVPSATLTANDTHLMVYNRSSTGGGGAIGADPSNGSVVHFYAPFTDGNSYSDQYNTGNGRVSGAVGGTPYGCLVATRIAANDHKIYRNAVQTATSATSTSLGTLGNVNIELYVYGFNNSGTVGNGTSSRLAGYSVGAGLSSAAVSNFYTDLQAFQTALGRQV